MQKWINIKNITDILKEEGLIENFEILGEGLNSTILMIKLKLTMFSTLSLKVLIFLLIKVVWIFYIRYKSGESKHWIISSPQNYF